MPDEPDSLALACLRRLDAKLDGAIDTLHEHGLRLARIETGKARMHRDQASDAEAVAHVQAQVDQLRDEITRIKRRLDVVD